MNYTKNNYGNWLQSLLVDSYLDAYLLEDCRKLETEHNCSTCGNFGTVYYEFQENTLNCRECIAKDF